MGYKQEQVRDPALRKLMTNRPYKPRTTAAAQETNLSAQYSERPGWARDAASGGNGWLRRGTELHFRRGRRGRRAFRLADPALRPRVRTCSGSVVGKRSGRAPPPCPYPEEDGRAACYRAPPPQASTAAGSCSGWVAQWHRQPAVSECLSCSSWSTRADG